MSPDRPGQPSAARATAALFLVSVLGLFLEMMLIRWIGTEIRIFAYLQNTVLVVCFLGLGMGCWTCRRPASARESLVWLFVLVGLLALPWTRQALNSITQAFRRWLAMGYFGTASNVSSTQQNSAIERTTTLLTRW